MFEKINLQKKYANKIARVTIPPMLGFTGLAIFAVVKKLAFISEHRIVFSSCCLITPISIAGTMLWLIFRNMRKVGLVCSNCQKITDKETVLTTLKCREIIIDNSKKEIE